MNIKKMISYRAVWMGIAMLWIILFHAELELTGFANVIKTIGYGGVDILVLASGLGNYYSYHRDEKPLEFLKRKLMRLAPVYIPFICLWCALKVALGEMSILHVPGNILGIQGFSSVDTGFNWYVPFILICYLLTPYLASYVRTNSFRNNILLVLVLIVLSIAFFKDRPHIIMATRIPIYVIGMIAARYDQIEIKVIRIPLIIAFLSGNVFLALFYRYTHVHLWNYGLHWYPFILISPFLCLAISQMAETGKKYKGIKTIVSFLEYIGGITFEIYLIHIFVFRMFKRFFSGSTYDNNYIWCLVIVFALSAAWIYSVIIKKIAGVVRS